MLLPCPTPYDLRSAFEAIDRAAMPAESLWLDSAEAAAYINRTEDYVRRVLRYDIPVHQRNKRGRLRFHRADLDRWLANNTTVPAR